MESCTSSPVLIKHLINVDSNICINGFSGFFHFLDLCLSKEISQFTEQRQIRLSPVY